jgi:hypothetical protein
VGKENVAVAFENLVEDNSRMLAAHQFCQLALALLDWSTPQVFAVQFNRVESDQHRIVTVALTADQIEHRQLARAARRIRETSLYQPGR